MAKAIPPLNNLHTFSIAAKHLSFSKAAHEMSVTQAAVSQQIRLLEERLGFALFQRLHRQLKLTKEGKALQTPVNLAVNQISDALELLRKDDLSGVLTVSTLPSLAMKWLIPRLAEFNQTYPDIDVHIHADIALTNFRTDIDDLAIRYGHQEDNDLQATKLMAEEVFLVASPSLLKGKYPLKKMTDIKHHTLLHDSVDCHLEAYGYTTLREINWQYFSEILGVDVTQNKNLTFTQAHLVLQAAGEGQGVAIARSALVADDLQSGRLVKIYPSKVIKSPGYHIVYPKAYANRKKIQVFEKWLLSVV